MITVKGATPDIYCQINEDLTITGHQGLAAMLENEIEEIRPDEQHVETLPYLYYELLERGWDCTIDPQSLKQADPDSGVF